MDNKTMLMWAGIGVVAWLLLTSGGTSTTVPSGSTGTPGGGPPPLPPGGHYVPWGGQGGGQQPGWGTQAGALVRAIGNAGTDGTQFIGSPMLSPQTSLNAYHRRLRR